MNATEISNKLLSVTNVELDELNTSFISPYNYYHDTSYFHLKSGTEHYRLLMYASALLSRSTIYDVGTYRCMSASALSYGGNNIVKSYDVIRSLPINPFLPNVNFYIGDVRNDQGLSKSNLIFLDVAHDGMYENQFYTHLHEIDWHGVLLLDDIHLNEPMINFWDGVVEDKYDLTGKGHWSGTGMVVF